MKIIHILCHTIPYNKDYIFDGWPARMAKNTQKYCHDLNQECWYAVTNIDKEVFYIREGIKYHLFPSWTLNKYLESFFGIIYSHKLIHALKSYVDKRTIIFIHGERSLLVWQIVSICRRNPLILQFHGYYAPGILKLVENFFITPFEKYYFKFINYFYITFQKRLDYLINTIGISYKDTEYQCYGVDYEQFKPGNKVNARKILNLPQNKRIILHVGLFNKTKGLDKIIKAHQKLKPKWNTYLVLIGGSRNDQDYDYCNNNADLLLERMPNKLISKYFVAADIYCILFAGEKIQYAGLGIASMEAAACNLPIINSNLDDVVQDLRYKLGYKATNLKELISRMENYFEEKKKFSNIRETSRKYFSWELVAKKTFNVYHKLDTS